MTAIPVDFYPSFKRGGRRPRATWAEKKKFYKVMGKRFVLLDKEMSLWLAVLVNREVVT